MKMKYGTAYNYLQGDIVIVPFPFTDLSYLKQRPVLILSKNPTQSDDVITCGITSRMKDRKNAVMIFNADLIEGSIPINSAVKVDKLFTLDKKIIKNKIGRLNQQTFEKVKQEFLKLV